VTWEEVADAGVKLVFDTEDVLARINKHGDVFHSVLNRKQTLPHT
jgi:hypothetical protein